MNIMVNKKFKREEIVEEFYEFIQFMYRIYPEILIQYQKLRGNKPLKLPILEYHKKDKQLLKLLK